MQSRPGPRCRRLAVWTRSHAATVFAFSSRVAGNPCGWVLAAITGWTRISSLRWRPRSATVLLAMSVGSEIVSHRIYC